MPDDQTARRTELGREVMLDDLDHRIDEERERVDALFLTTEKRIADLERKEEGRDRRWDITVRAFTAIAAAMIGSVVAGLIALGFHP